MTKSEEYKNDVEIQWCPGCPNFGILRAFRNTLADLGKKPHEVCLVSGIGQAAKLPHYLNCHFFNGLHGRALPVATAINAVNPELTTIVVTGDGDAYGEGGNHFPHAIRRNPNITVIVHNNAIYALTKGQASPTTMQGAIRSLQFEGVRLTPLNMPAVAILHGCTFVARGFAGDTQHLQSILKRAIEHPGFAYVDVIQPCITWGKRPLKWYQERVYKLDESYDPTDRAEAIRKTEEREDRFPVGILYHRESRPGFGDWFRDNIRSEPLHGARPGQKEVIDEMLAI